MRHLPVIAAFTFLHSSLALAQQTDTLIPDHQMTPVSLDMIAGGGYVRGGYSPRADMTVYAVGSPAVSGGGWYSSGVNVYDDVTFGPAYPGNPAPLVIDAVALSLFVSPTAQPDDDHLYTRFSFYPDHANSAPSATTPYSGTPVTWTLDWGAGWSTGIPAYFPDPVAFDTSVTLDSSNVFNAGPDDRTCGVKIELFLDPALTRYANGWQVVRRGSLPASPLTLVTGDSDLYGWFSDTTGVTHGEIPNSQRSGGVSNQRATYLALRATGLCGTADFDGDGDSGTDADIEAFFACIAGNCCSQCLPRGADFNGDGDTGTDADIEAFFRVLSGGTC